MPSISSSSSTTSPRRLRHALLLAVLDQVHHLVQRDLDARGVVAERLRGRLQPRRVAVVIGAEHVDRDGRSRARACRRGRRGRRRGTSASRPTCSSTRSLSSPNSLARSQVAPSLLEQVARPPGRASSARSTPPEPCRSTSFVSDVHVARGSARASRGCAANISSTPARPNSSAGASGESPVSVGELAISDSPW